MTDTYAIHAVRYGRVARKRRDNMIFCPPDRQDEDMPIDYFFWVLKGASGTVVVDTGYGADLAAELGREFVCDPIGSLREIDVDPETVETVILTHLHYDHAGNIPSFPNARFVLHADELPFATGWYAQEPAFGFVYHRDHVRAAVSLVYERRVTFVDGDTTMAPGIELYHIPGHSPGHLSVRVLTERGWVLLAIDAAHFVENMVERRPYPLYLDLAQTMRGYDRLREISPDLSMIFGGHDSTVIDRYPPSRPGLEDKVVRLDLPPLNAKSTGGA